MANKQLLKIPNRLYGRFDDTKGVIRSTDNTMAKRKSTMIDKTLHRKQKIEQH